MPEFTDTSSPGTCIFCKLVAGELPSARVFEDDLTLAFMDLGQVNPGHVLVATRRHAATLFETTEDEAAAVMRVAWRLARAARTAFAPEGLNLFQANGRVAEQTVNHFHMHVLPRNTGDGLHLTWPRPEPGPEALQRYAGQLREALNAA
ncbi:MAG: HIT family protein [Ottowia sp.]|nr:HIT family protein [Ottowia sp.]